MYICIYVCMEVRRYVCIYLYIHTYIHTYIYRYTHIYTYRQTDRHTYIHIQTCDPGGNREATSMGNTIHRSHRGHTEHKGHRWESRSEINIKLLFKDLQVPSVSGGNHEAKSMVGVVVLAGPFPQGI